MKSKIVSPNELFKTASIPSSMIVALPRSSCFIAAGPISARYTLSSRSKPTLGVRCQPSERESSRQSSLQRASAVAPTIRTQRQSSSNR